jgi:hypothetical protein
MLQAYPGKAFPVDGSQTPIQTGRTGTGTGMPQGAVQGTITAIRQEDGRQSVEIQSAQGRIRLQADGEFQVGEKVRVHLPHAGQGGDVRLEKLPLPLPQPNAEGLPGKGADFQGKLAVLNELRAFEENLGRWIGGRQPGLPGQAQAAMAQGAGLAAGVGGGGFTGSAVTAALTGTGAGADLESLLRLPLPELLKRVLAREGGRDMLAQNLLGLGHQAFAALMDGLEESAGKAGGPGDSGKASLLQMLRVMRREGEAGAGTARPDVHGMAGRVASGGTDARVTTSMGPRDMGAFWPAGPESAGGTANRSASGINGQAMPWMGRVIERQEVGGSMAFAGGRMLPAPSKDGADSTMFRYLLDLGGRTLEVRGAQARQPGEFVHFEIERQGARLQARFLDPAQAMPATLRAAFAAAPPDGKAALQVSARFLSEFKSEPFFDRLVKDFGEVLFQSGRLSLPEGQHAWKAGSLPNPRELDTLLRLFVAFPRDTDQPERQAKTWSDAARDPRALMDLLRDLKPGGDTALLRTGTPLRLAGPLSPQEAGLPPPPGSAGTEKGAEALATLLRGALPEVFKSPELLDLARQPALSGNPDAKDQQAAKFLLQAFSGLMPREDDMREGRPAPFYFYQGQDWRGLQVTWQRDGERAAHERRDPTAPVKVRVETEARHMGKVDVGAVLTEGRLMLDFRNQFHDVRELLEENIPELEKSLALLDVRIEAWTYARMPDAPNVLPTAGWVRPASLDGGNLDLVG